MKFLCLAYFEEHQWDALSASEREAYLQASSAYDEEMWRSGRWVGTGEMLQSARTAKTLRSSGGKIDVTDGPYAETKEQLGGLAVLEADDMNHAVELMLKHPGVRLGGCCEIRPADEATNAVVAARYNQIQQDLAR